MSDETNHEEERVEVEEETCEEVRVGKRISFMDPDGEFTDPESPEESEGEYDEDEEEEEDIDDRLYTDDDKEILRDAFAQFDTDNSGFITPEDLGTLLKSLGQNPTDEQMEELMKSLDPEGKGKIGVDQFLSMMEERLVISDWNEKDEERLFIKAFETLDPENTGKIPAAALRSVVTSYGNLQLNETEAEDLIQRADLNQDGLVSYDEFMRLFLGKRNNEQSL